MVMLIRLAISYMTKVGPASKKVGNTVLFIADKLMLINIEQSKRDVNRAQKQATHSTSASSPHPFHSQLINCYQRDLTNDVINNSS